MSTKTKGREFKTKRRVKGWAGLAPVLESVKAKFQELVLSPRSDHGEGDPPGTEEGDGLALPHDRLAGAVV